MLRQISLDSSQRIGISPQVNLPQDPPFERLLVGVVAGVDRVTSTITSLIPRFGDPFAHLGCSGDAGIIFGLFHTHPAEKKHVYQRWRNLGGLYYTEQR